MSARGAQQAKVGAGPAGAAGAGWELFHANAQIWPAVLEHCDAARQSLALEQFIFSPHGIGARLLDVLALKARQGVEVRLLVDGFGSRGLRESDPAQALLRAGGQIVVYHSIADTLRHPVRRLHRLHRKTVVRDGESAIIGGACYHDRMSDWRDTMIRIDGAIARDTLAIFETVWGRARRVASELPRPPAEDSAAPWAYMISTPVKPRRHELYHTLLGRISGAQEEVTLTTPYLVPDLTFCRAIARTAKRGVRVRIVMPARSDHPSLDVIGGGYARYLAARGAAIHRYEPSMLHCKLALIDGKWGSVSSFNLDILSFRMNLESGVTGTDPQLCAALADQLERDIAASSPL